MRYFFTTIAIAATLAAPAQELWTMEQCMAYAAMHASSVVQAKWDLASATASRNEALADFFPSVSAQVGSQFSWGRNIDPETNTYNDVTTFNNGYGVYASLRIFDGGQTLNRYKQARNERKRFLNAVEMQRDDSAIAAMMAFADAFYYQHSIRIAEDRLRQSEGMLTFTTTQEELGIKGAPDVAQAES
ncbi:MAG: TolC family protein, partial [Muribaculaceae bacterium]|nr:TolC family protein [Muribaculaceae bacterium]